MPANLITRANDLLNYLEEIIRLGNKVTYDIDEHDIYKLYETDLILAENITIEKDESWITPASVSIERPIIPSSPEPEEDLKKWIVFPGEKLEQPILPSKESINDKIEKEDKLGDSYKNFINYEDLLNSYEKYIEEWQKWYQEIQPLIQVKELYKDLFQVRKKLQYEEDLELVLGYGIIIWRHNDRTLKYPIVTHNMVVTHNPEKNLIEVISPDDGTWKLEIEQLNDTVNQDLSTIRNAFENANSEGEKNQFLDLLYQVKGLAADSELISMDLLNSNRANSQLKIIDGWVLFARKKNQNELLNDIFSFRKQINDNGTPITSIIENVLNDPNNNSISYHEEDFHDEWNSMLDQEILFPKETNEEQIRILDYLKKSDGVVVQGPPGTGKSHTIANLISHYIAHGDRVLVTSQKEQALKVLDNMLPSSLRSLCISVLSNDKDRSKKLEKAVSQITNILTNMSIHNLKKEKENLVSDFDVKKAKLEKIKNELHYLAKKGMPVKIDILNEPLSPAEAQKYISNKANKYIWFKDMPLYEKEQIIIDNQDAIILKAKINFSKEDIDELSKIRKEIGTYYNDLHEYKIPESKQLLTTDEFKSMAEGLRKIHLIEEEANKYYQDVNINYDFTLINNTISNLEKAVKIQSKIADSWALDFIKDNIDIKTKIEDSLNELKDLYDDIVDLNDQLTLTTKIELDNNVEYNSYKVFVEEAYNRILAGKNPWGLLSVFDNGKKKALQKVRLNDMVPEGPKEWKMILSYITLQIKLKVFSSSWEGFRAHFPYNQIPELKENSFTEIKLNFINLIYSFNYIFKLKPDIKSCINKLLVGDKSSIINDIESEVGNLLGFIKLKKDQWDIKKSERQYKELLDDLEIVNLMNGHPIVNEFLTCLRKDYNEIKNMSSRWDVAYRKLKTIENYKPAFNRYQEIVNMVEEQAPIWAKDLKKSDVDFESLHFSDWNEAWRFNILQKYLIDINQSENKIAEYEKQLKTYQSEIKILKEKLVLVNTRINLINNTTDSSLTSLKKWKLAMDKYGKGYGKYAPRYRKNAQEYMQSAREAVPAWIMPVHLVSESTSKRMGSFDVVIIDEASQCDIKSLLVLFRANKVIVVGDDKQISPSAVGKTYDIVFSLIDQHLKDLPHGKEFTLTTSLYDLAQLFFTSQTLMLKEHFRCLPEIIEFSNQNFYQGEILPLRNIPDAQKLNPTLETVFIPHGFREQKINKPEANAICTKIKEMVDNPKYQGKTIGVISLTGYDQAKYIFNKIDDYLSPFEQEKIKFHVGDAYAFQGDERDIILLSMVVGGENDSYRALTSTSNKQRFNVATSRARDKLILFHSVELGKDLTNQTDLRYQLLHYMKNGTELKNSLKNKREKCESPFEEDVFDWLTEKGYKVNPQVKVGNFRIDMVVEGKKNELAVECDGDRWHPPSKWWDDKMRQRQLERAGWIFWRVSGTNFYRDKVGAMKSIIKKLDELEIYPIVKQPLKGDPDKNNSAIESKRKTIKNPVLTEKNLKSLFEDDIINNKPQSLFDHTNGEITDENKEDQKDKYKLDRDDKLNESNKGDNSQIYHKKSDSDDITKSLGINDDVSDRNNNNEIASEPKSKPQKREDKEKKPKNKYDFSINDVVENKKKKRGKVKKIIDDKLLVSVGKGKTDEWPINECKFVRKGKVSKGKSDSLNKKNEYKNLISEEIQKDESKRCPKCGEDMIVKMGRYGAFWGCSSYPNCKATERLEQTIVKEVVARMGIACPKDDCNGHIRYINTGKSAFFGCSKYPDCDFIEFF
ncbi:topoisomerase DNA-binding C4 zinc finger domain-containing protein [Natronospora cellulosivora (SeqCode)]